MTPEETLHLLGPYLPTDRFRALLRSANLPTESNGAALLVDLSGFTALTAYLVNKNSAGRASDTLRRMLNPMYEAITGQVFNCGGSVIRFTGDGFLAWFDEQQWRLLSHSQPIPAMLCAVAAGLEMHVVIERFDRIWRKMDAELDLGDALDQIGGLRAKVVVNRGTAYRSVVGDQHYGLMDVISGPVVTALLSVASQAQPGRVTVDQSAIGVLREGHAVFEADKGGRVIVNSLPPDTVTAARTRRWPAWRVEGADAETVLDTVRPFVAAQMREQAERRLGNYVGELRDALPMFAQVDIAADSPELGYEALNRCVIQLQTILDELGGRLVSIEAAGQSHTLFSTFGAPVTYGDDAERAVSAAMLLREWGAKQDTIDSMRIAISHGLLYAGIVGGEVRHEYSAIGDETNLAARLMDKAEPGQILVTSRLAKETRHRILYHELPSIRVRGRDDDIVISEPLARRTGPARRAQAGDIVGRAAEIDQIQQSLNAVTAGIPRILRIEGEAGIGKSRMVAELARLAKESGFRVAHGDCLSTERSTALLPWRELMATLMGLEQDSLPSDAIRILTSELQRMNPEWSVRLPLLAEMLQLPVQDTPATEALTGRARRQAIFALMGDLIFQYAHEQRLCLIFEDIHWIDEVSEALVMEVARRLSVEPEPIMLVLVHRTLPEFEYTLEVIPVVAELYTHSLIELGELDRDGVRLLVENYLHVASSLELSELSAFIYDKTQGNPFFVREVVDALRDTGVITVKGKIAIVDPDLDKTALPRTVHELAQARIDRLAETDKLVLKVASVIGYEFQVPVLLGSLPIAMESDELLDRLHSLEERDFIRLEDASTDLTYTFKHTIIQEVVYQSLLLGQRRLLHRAVAVTIETLFPEAIERLANHFWAAKENDNYGGAWNYLRAAAEKTSREYANQAALLHLDHAIELVSNKRTREELNIGDREQFELRGMRLTILLRIGSSKRALAELDGVSLLAERSGREDWRTIAQTFRARFFIQSSQWLEALNEARGALALAHSLNNDELAWDASVLLCEVYRNLNLNSALTQALPQMRDLVQRLNDPRKQIQMILLEVDDLYREQPQLAHNRVQYALEQAHGLNDLVLEAACWEIFATLYIRDSSPSTALQAYMYQVTLLKQIGDRRGEGKTHNHIGATLVGLGQFTEGNNAILKAYQILHQLDEQWGEAHSLLLLGIIAGHRNAYDEALAYMYRGVSLFRALSARADIARALIHIANMSILKGDMKIARSSLNEVLAITEALDLRAQIAEASAALAEMELLQGNLDAARQALDAVLPILEGGHLYELEQPGLAFRRAILALERLDQLDAAESLRVIFRRQTDAILGSLVDPDWRESYLLIWFHRDLLAQPKTE